MPAQPENDRLGPTVCRYCSEEHCSRDISSVYTWNGIKEVYSEILSETFNVTIVCSEDLSKVVSHQMCESCINRLRDASEFKKQVLEGEQALQQYLSQPPQNSLDLQYDNVAGSEVIEDQVKEEVESVDGISAGYDDDPTDCEDEPQEQLSTDLVIKKETKESEEPYHIKTRKRKTTETTKKVEKTAKKTKKRDTSKTSKSLPKKKDLAVGDAARKNAVAILRYSTAYPFQPSKRSFRCCFCAYAASEHLEPTAFRHHMDTTHSHIDRSTCLKHPNDSMTRVDITNLKCKDCLSTFESLEGIAKHLVHNHGYDLDLHQSVGLVPIRLESNRCACVLCAKSYSTLHQLSRHSGTHFVRNICYKCGSNFETLKGLKKHVIFKHSKHKYLCPTCEMPFPDVNARKEHLLTNKKCRSMKCKYCKERYLCTETLNKHVVEAHGKDITTYPCPECGEIFEKRIRRYLHFKIAHTDDFKCIHCDSKFSTKRYLEEHIARVHTFERKYRCGTCDKAFTDARTLRIHTFVHDQSKKQPCPACNRAFTFKIRLKHHVQKYHPDILPSVFPAATQ